LSAPDLARSTSRTSTASSARQPRLRADRPRPDLGALRPDHGPRSRRRSSCRWSPRARARAATTPTPTPTATPTTGDDQVQTRRGRGSPTASASPTSPVIYEESVTDYVNWEDFGHRRPDLGRGPATSGAGSTCPASSSSSASARTSASASRWTGARCSRATATTRPPTQQEGRRLRDLGQGEKKAYWISKSWSRAPAGRARRPAGPGVLPVPEAAAGTTANDSVIPVPDYVYYQDQAEEIDKLTARIAELQDALKVRGFYAGDSKTNLNNLLNADNNTLIPVPDWVTLKDGGGARAWSSGGRSTGGGAGAERLHRTAPAADQRRLPDHRRRRHHARHGRPRGPRRPRRRSRRLGHAAGPRPPDRDDALRPRQSCGSRARSSPPSSSAETLKAMTGVKLPTERREAPPGDRPSPPSPPWLRLPVRSSRPASASTAPGANWKTPSTPRLTR
jgi:hypothetical protein